jgi:hypothetical protein
VNVSPVRRIFQMGLKIRNQKFLRSAGGTKRAWAVNFPCPHARIEAPVFDELAVSMTTEQEFRQKLRKISALFEGATKPYRYPRQRLTTVVLRAPRSFINKTLWPEYLQIEKALHEYLNEATEQIIREEVFGNSDEAEEPEG